MHWTTVSALGGAVVLCGVLLRPDNAPELPKSDAADAVVVRGRGVPPSVQATSEAEPEKRRVSSDAPATSAQGLAPGTCFTQTDSEGNVEGTCNLAPSQADHAIHSPFG